jgi:hypothetical protein
MALYDRQFNREPVMCEGCTADEHWRCGLQTWCECECDGSVDWGMHEIDPDEGLSAADPWEGQLIDKEQE